MKAVASYMQKWLSITMSTMQIDMCEGQLCPYPHKLTMQLTCNEQQGVISSYHVSVVAIDVMHQVTNLPVPICS